MSLLLLLLLPLRLTEKLLGSRGRPRPRRQRVVSYPPLEGRVSRRVDACCASSDLTPPASPHCTAFHRLGILFDGSGPVRELQKSLT